MFSNLIFLILKLFLYMTIFVVIGTIFTVIISLLYVNSAGYCRDCDTGIGLVGIGFILSLIATPLIIILGDRFLSRDSETE